MHVSCGCGKPLLLRPRSSTSRLPCCATASKIGQIHTDLRTKQRSATDIVEGHLERISSQDATLQSFISVASSEALAQAKQLDERIASEGPNGLPALAGVPFAIKDNICTKGLPTSAGSRVLEGHVPAYDATAVAKLKAAGAIIIGKTNMDEFGMGSSTENSAYHVTRNPWDTSRVPGGSSGGSAAAVAAGLAPAALGTDTGGSIRQPAHFCGVVGLKPTYGRVSRYGLIAYASSLDVVGPVAATVEDAARILTVIAGPDPRDSTSSHRPAGDYAAGLAPVEQLGSRPLQGRRIGLISETIGEGVSQDVNEAVQKAVAHLELLGAVVEHVSLPTFKVGLPAYYVIATSEASSNLARYDGMRYGLRQRADKLRDMYGSTRQMGLGPEVKRRILMGTFALSAGYYDAYYKRAQQVRTLVLQELNTALQTFDVLLSPTAPTPAYKLGQVVDDPLEMYKGDLMTVNINLSGLPAVTVPCHVTTATDESCRLPVGVQFVGRMFGEASMLEIAHVFEQTGKFLVDYSCSTV